MILLYREEYLNILLCKPLYGVVFYGGIMIKQAPSSLLFVLFGGADFEFDSSCPVDECLSRIEYISERRSSRAKKKEAVFSSIGEYSYKFTFDKREAGTVIVIKGRFEGRLDDATQVVGHAKVGLATWIWIIYPIIFALLLLNSIPIISLLMILFSLLWLYLSARACRNLPRRLFELLSCEKQTKVRGKRKI